jgi:hypothetical protein
MQGQFHEYWDAAGVSSGDVLTFEPNQPSPGMIKVQRYPQGRGLEDALLPQTGRDGMSTAQVRSGPGHATTASDANELGATAAHPHQQQPGSLSSLGHPNRWTELGDGSAVKTVYKSTLVHQQCPIAGWLFNKVSLAEHLLSPAGLESLVRNPLLPICEVTI